jgi:signal transduction histidine kinase
MTSTHLDRNPTATLGFAALVHEMHGRVASIAMFTTELNIDKRRYDPTWLDDRLTRIHRAAAEMQRIIDAVKRLEDDSLPHRVPIDLTALSARVLQGHVERMPGFGRAKIRIQSAIQVVGDLEEIEIVLGNLVGNALKFSSRREIPEVRVTTTTELDRIVVHVSDNGVGIASEDAARIFQPFTRCHTDFEGSGVGLAVARRIVERHGGRIWAKGELGLGTTISFSI